MVRTCQPTFSAAFVAHIEATFHDEAEKNGLCAPVPRAAGGKSRRPALHLVAAELSDA
jgi:hypothetical protein